MKKYIVLVIRVNMRDFDGDFFGMNRSLSWSAFLFVKSLDLRAKKEENLLL